MNAAAALAIALAGLFTAVPLRAQDTAPDTAVRLMLNLPAYRLDAIARHRVEYSMHVAIGMRTHQTPVGRFAVSTITWNPWWYPPPSPWAAGDTITPPCPQNPVGRVKLGFGSRYFIHGTPRPRSIGRAASHGCVRAVQDDALNLAAYLVRRVLPDSAAAAERYAAGQETHLLRLPQPIPLEIRYDLAEVRLDTLWLYPDPYGRVPASAARLRQAMRALATVRDTTAIPRAALAVFVARSRRAAVGVPLDSL